MKIHIEKCSAFYCVGEMLNVSIQMATVAHTTTFFEHPSRRCPNSPSPKLNYFKTKKQKKVKQNYCILVFEERGKSEYLEKSREKALGARTRSNTNLNLHNNIMTSSPTLVGGECSHHHAIPVPWKIAEESETVLNLNSKLYRQ